MTPQPPETNVDAGTLPQDDRGSFSLDVEERSIQVAFREVSDALAVRATIQDQVEAQERLTAQAADVQRLTQARYDRGVDGYLALLDAQRSLYAAQRGLVQTRLAEILNRIELYRALGGGGAPEA